MIRPALYATLGFLLAIPSLALALAVFQPVQGGTGTSVAPSYGQILVGKSDGTYAPQATSTLNVSSAPGGASSTIQYNANGTLTGNTGLIYTGTYVGIGTTSPASTLSVSGNGYITGGLGVGVVNTAAGTLQVSSTATVLGGTINLYNGNTWDAKINQTVGSLFSIDNGGSTRFWITPTGNIGIATSSPASTLSVQGNSYFTGGVGLGLVNSTNGSIAWGAGLGAINHLVGPSDQTFAFIGGGNNTTAPQGISITGGTVATNQPGNGGAITITAGGRNNTAGHAGTGGAVTINSGSVGTENSSGNAGDSSGAISVSSPAGGANIASTGSTVGGNSGSITISTGAGGAATASASGTGGNSGNIVLQTGAGGAGGAASGLVGSIQLLGGNVGVATTSPAKPLSVQGDSLISGTETAGNLVATSTLTTNGTATSTITGGLTIKGVVTTGYKTPGFTYATTTAWTGTTTIQLPSPFVNDKIDAIQCYTTVGTLWADFYHTSTHLTLFSASTTQGVESFSSNNSMTAGEKWYVDFGTPASSPTTVTCSIEKENTSY